MLQIYTDTKKMQIDVVQQKPRPHFHKSLLDILLDYCRDLEKLWKNAMGVASSLHSYGVSGKVLTIIKSFLSGRTME